MTRTDAFQQPMRHPAVAHVVFRVDLKEAVDRLVNLDLAKMLGLEAGAGQPRRVEGRKALLPAMKIGDIHVHARRPSGLSIGWR